jgi:hypothetical protein
MSELIKLCLKYFSVINIIENILITKTFKIMLKISGLHQRQRRFHLQDHLYYIKVRLKKVQERPPLLSELLQLLEDGFNYILVNLRQFYNIDDHNIAFLTLYQEPMINALNTGGFDLQENSSQMVDRILKMLQQFLISNSSLRLNNTFKVYIKVLSIEHEKYKKGKKKKKNPIKFIKKKRYGARNENKISKNYWSIDVPSGFGSMPNIFKNKCLLTCTILGHLQNIFFKTNRKDKRFIYAQNVNSSIKTKQNHGCKVLLSELEKLYESTNLDINGPYDLIETTKILSEYFKCQFFIFDAIDNSNKLRFMYPENFDDTLEPIYLYQPLNEPDHVIFIRHINSYFKSNLRVCFFCKRTFKSHRYNHFCVKMKICFACHRNFCTKETYLHEKLQQNYCDKNITNEKSFLCKICNVTIYSSHCYKAHKLLCAGKGSFGWKCLKCNKFTYRIGNSNSKLMENIHQCGEKKCIYCSQPKDSNHLCKLKVEHFPTSWPKIAFIGMEHTITTTDNCLQCYEVKNNFRITNELTWKVLKLHEKFPSLVCEKHLNLNKHSEPNIIVIYKEAERGNFNRYILTANESEIHDSFEKDILSFQYVDSEISKFHESKENLHRRTKVTEDFSQNLKKLQNVKASNLGTKLVQLITKPEWSNTTFISQDCKSQNYNCILSFFIQNGFCPKVIQNGHKIIFMEIPNLNLRFITSNSYVDVSEFDLAKQYDIPFDPFYFPENLNSTQLLTLDGTIPSYKHFWNFSDSDTEKRNKKNFVTNFKTTYKSWNFEKELLRFCEEKLWLLTLSSLKFLSECFQFQKEIKKEKTEQSKYFIHPFGYHICSLASFSFKLFKVFYLNYEEIYCVQNEFGKTSKNVSKIEYEWASFMEYENPGAKFLSAFNNDKGQQYFKEAIPDLYSPITKEAHFFHGCHWHGHLDGCLTNLNANLNTKNPVGITYQELNKKFLLKASKLLENNKDKIVKVTTHWECLYRQKRTEKEIQYFLKFHFRPHPLIRLCPRDCVRGAYCDVYALKWNKKNNSHETFHFFDVNGLYSYCAINYDYFVGKYDILIGNETRNISFENNAFVYNNKILYGTMLVTIVPPKDLFLPFLLYRTSDGKTINTLCSKCCENTCTHCTHSDNERAITGSYFTSEIIYAIRHNYKLLHIHECHCYYSMKPILKDFIKKINFLKLMNSDCLKDYKTYDYKNLYCQYLNNEMNLSEPFSLTVNNVKDNKGKRTLFKLMANSFFGKFAQKHNKSKTLFAANQTQLEEIYFSYDEVKDIFCLNDEVCQVQVKPNEFKLPPNRNSNCYLGGQITAYARQVMHEHLTNLLKIGATLYQTDTDSICFTLPNDQSIPLLISHSLGHFKKEVDGNIVSFYSLGSKNYVIVYEKDNVYKSITKSKGFSLVSDLNQTKLNENLYLHYIDQFSKHISEKKEVNQLRYKRRKLDHFQIEPNLEPLTFTNDVSKRRFVCTNTKHFVTLPYGF